MTAAAGSSATVSAPRPGWRVFSAGVGVLAMLAVVWYIGPLVAIAGRVPLDGAPARGIAMAAIVALALINAGWRAARAHRTNRELLAGMGAGAAPTDATTATPAGAREVALLEDRFEQALALLRRRRVGGRRFGLGAFGDAPYVYELPWYVIIGAPGAGKTTALVKSGLEFPLEAQLGQKMVRGIGGTRNCDWWFTSDAVLLDTAGRYTTQDSDRAADRDAWLGFLDLLARCRPGRPINGVLLTLSVADLLNPDPDKRRAHALALRERINELNSRLGIRLPIYTLITKTDLLAGFAEFFADFDKDERAQIWGVTFPFDTEETSDDPVSRLPSDLAALESRLNERLIDRLQSERDVVRRAAIYAFPQQWRVLHETLLELLPLIYGDSGAPGQPQPFLRGVYFTSATQEGTPMDRAIGGIARTLGLTSRLVPALRSSAKTFFVTRMLRDVVLQEAGLAGTNLRWQRRRVMLGWGLRAAMATIAASAIGLAWLAYERGHAHIVEAEAGVGTLERGVGAAKGSTVTDLAALLPALQALQSLATPGTTTGASGGALADALASLDRLLGTGDTVTSVADDAYRGFLKDAFLPRIAARLEERLRGASRDHLERLYEDLKAYLMLFSGRNFDAPALRAFLAADWETTLPASADDRAALQQHLDRLLASGEVGAPSQAEPGVVAATRTLLGGVPLAQRAYSRLQQLDLGAQAPPFSVDAAAANTGGAAARRLFVRASGEAQMRGVPALYTRPVFEHGFNQRTQEVLRQLAGEQGWVLGVSAATSLEPGAQAQLVGEVDRLYVADYVRLWDGLVKDLRLAPTTTLAASADQAQALGHTESPLQSLLRAIVRELGVAPAGPAAAAPTGGDEPLVDPRFEPLRQYVTGTSPPLTDTLGALGRLGSYLTAVDDAAKRHAEPPQSEVLRELALAAPRAPDPIRSMLLQLTQTGSTLSFAALREPLARRVADELGPECTRATAGRYPFARAGGEEISREAFTKTFAAGGALDGFFQRSLAPYVDTASRPWAYRSADGARGDTPEGLQAFQRAQAIRASFFRDNGRALGTTLEFKLLDLDPTLRQLTLAVDGQVLRFGRDQKPAQTLQWPGADGPAGVHLQTTSTAGAASADFPFEGPWGLLRLFDRARMEPGASPDRVLVVFDVEGHKAKFEVRSAAPVNPLLRQDLEQFQCPKRL